MKNLLQKLLSLDLIVNKYCERKVKRFSVKILKDPEI